MRDVVCGDGNVVGGRVASASHPAVWWSGVLRDGGLVVRGLVGQRSGGLAAWWSEMRLSLGRIRGLSGCVVQNASESARIPPDPAKTVELRRISDQPTRYHPDSRRSPHERRRKGDGRAVGLSCGSESCARRPESRADCQKPNPTPVQDSRTSPSLLIRAAHQPAPEMPQAGLLRWVLRCRAGARGARVSPGLSQSSRRAAGSGRRSRRR